MVLAWLLDNVSWILPVEISWVLDRSCFYVEGVGIKELGWARRVGLRSSI